MLKTDAMQTREVLIIICVSALLSITSCEGILEPDPANYYSKDLLLKDMPFAEGVLLNGYRISGTSPSPEAVATDDAVSNLNGDDFRRMANGEWTSQFNPVSAWSDAYQKIYYLNYFLTIVDDVDWSWSDERIDDLFRLRYTGEAYGLRAWHSFELLKRHGGRTADGNLMGYVILEKPMFKDSDWRLPRNSYEECVRSIYNDIDEGIKRLPLDYTRTEDAIYNTVFGSQNQGRVSARILMALRSRVSLHAASQAFNPSSEKWEFAADASASLLILIEGISGLSQSGNTWYLNRNSDEIIWRQDAQSINSWERENFPPSMYGTGRTNPTQNLVDAFPMQNGYPISDLANSQYDPNNPYNSRDARLAKYILYNGGNIGDTQINTTTEGSPDGLNNSANATRTGYYLKKFMNKSVNLEPNINSTKTHFYTLFRYTEIFLNYAEAANEVWGPEGDPRGYGFTAASIMSAIRERAGIIQPDAYLSSITTKEEMRDLIRNERRIELCFEDFRFWDLRRWGVELSEKAKGISITGDVFTVIDIEDRNYQSYMVYGPIPYLDLLKCDQLIQNTGW